MLLPCDGTSRCMQCDIQFSFRVRKSNCRACGKVCTCVVCDCGSSTERKLSCCTECYIERILSCVSPCRLFALTVPNTRLFYCTKVKKIRSANLVMKRPIPKVIIYCVYILVCLLLCLHMCNLRGMAVLCSQTYELIMFVGCSHLYLCSMADPMSV